VECFWGRVDSSTPPPSQYKDEVRTHPEINNSTKYAAALAIDDTNLTALLIDRPNPDKQTPDISPKDNGGASQDVHLTAMLCQMICIV
jgi:hypothetical protein